MPILQPMLILMVLLLGVRLHTRTYTAVYHVHTSDRFAVRYGRFVQEALPLNGHSDDCRVSAVPTILRGDKAPNLLASSAVKTQTHYTSVCPDQSK